MRKMRNLILTFLLMFVGVVSASAKTIYTAYEAGDEIEVNVSDTDKIKFYVVEDSSSDSDTVTAITYNFVDQNKYTFAEAESLLNTQKGIWKNVDSISLPSAKKLLNVDVDLEDEYSSETFTSPSWVSPKTSEFTEYWLSELAYDGAHAVIWGMDTHYNSQFHLSSKDDTDKIYVKLLIEVSKEHVVEGAYVEEEDPLWNSFVEKFKTTELVSLYDDTEIGLEITSTENSLSIVLTEGEQTFTTKFTYENGILKYDSETKSDEMIFADSIWQMNAIYALSQLKGYNINRVSKWLEEHEDKVLTLENDGIKYTSKDFNYEDETEMGTTTIESIILTSLELDIENGLKSYNEEKISIYEFIFGENQTYKFKETKELKFEIDGEYSEFDKVYINDKLLEAEKYTVSEGDESTIIVLKQSYLDSLNNGTHTIKVVYKDAEYAQTTFVVEKTVKNPTTGIVFKYGLFILIGLISGISYLLIRKQSKFPKHN